MRDGYGGDDTASLVKARRELAASYGLAAPGPGRDVIAAHLARVDDELSQREGSDR